MELRNLCDELNKAVEEAKSGLILIRDPGEGSGNIHLIDQMQPGEVLNELRTGVVKWYSPEKGFGFLIDDTTRMEYFIHHTS